MIQNAAAPNPTPGGFDNTPISSQQGSTLIHSNNPAPTPDPSTILPGIPDTFVRLAQARLTAQIGAQAYLIPTNQMNALIAKIWESPAIQYDYNQSLIDKSTWLPALAQQVSQEIFAPSTGDNSLTVDYVNLKLASGRGLSLAEQTALSNVTQAQGARVPAPFGTQTVSGYDFGAPMPKGGWNGTGQSFGWPTHMGVDYGTPADSRIVAPFAGTIEVKTGIEGYGNQVLLHLDNGWTLAFGHIEQGFGNGTRVNPGDLIATSGQNVGSARGAVTLVTWQDPSGKFENPHDVLDPIFKGVSFSMLKDASGNPLTSLAGTGMPSVDQALDSEYPSVRQEWTKYFGSPPSPNDVYNVVQHGVSPGQWADYIRSLPSHIPGMPAGNAYDMRQIVDGISTQMYGHLSTDGIVAELHGKGITAPGQIQLYYDAMPGKDLDQRTYNEIFHANTAVTYNIFNDKGADPRIISAQAQAHIQSGEHGGGGYT